MAQRCTWHNGAHGTTAHKFLITTITNAIIDAEQIIMRKQSEGATDNDQQIEAALKDLHDKVYKSVHAAAKAHAVAESTL